MRQIKWAAMVVGFSLLTTACASALGSTRLEGLSALTEELGGAPSRQAATPLQSLADEAEQQAPQLDIVQLDLTPANELFVFILLARPQAAQTADQDALTAFFRTAVEAIWAAAAKHAPEATFVNVAFMQAVNVSTLDKGPALGAILVGAIRVEMTQANRYLAGSPDQASQDAFWESPAVEITRLNQTYVGRPNHPLRSQET